MSGALKALRDSVTFYGSLGLFGAICLTWSIPALPLYLVLPPRVGAALSRWVMTVAFGGYARFVELVGVYKLDIKGIDAAYKAPAVVLAPNHLSIIDAIFIITRHPRLVCVMKSRLMNNLFL